MFLSQKGFYFQKNNVRNIKKMIFGQIIYEKLPKRTLSFLIDSLRWLSLNEAKELEIISSSTASLLSLHYTYERSAPEPCRHQMSTYWGLSQSKIVFRYQSSGEAL